MRVEDAELLLTAILEAAGDDEIEARLAGLRATAERLAEHKNVQAWGTAAEYFGQAIVKRARSWLKEAFAGEPADAVWAPATLSDTGNAELFAVQHAEWARYVPGLEWLVYDEGWGAASVITAPPSNWPSVRPAVATSRLPPATIRSSPRS